MNKKTKKPKLQDLWQELRRPELQEKVRRQLSERTHFQQGLAVEALARAFFRQSTYQIGQPNVITMVGRDIEHAEWLCRTFAQTLSDNMSTKPIVIDSREKPHWLEVCENGFAFIFIREAKHMMNEGLFEFRREGRKDYGEQLHEQTLDHLKTLKSGFLRTPDGKVNYENATFVFLEDAEYWFDLLGETRNVDELTNATENSFLKKAAERAHRLCYGREESAEQNVSGFQETGDLVPLNPASFTELVDYIDIDACSLGEHERPFNGRQTGHLHYNDAESKFILFLSCLNEPGLTFKNLRMKEENWAYNLAQDLGAYNDSSLDPEDSVIGLHSGSSEGSARRFVEDLKSDQNIRVSIFHSSPVPAITLNSLVNGKNIQPKQFEDVSQLSSYSPELGIVYDNLDDPVWVLDVLRDLRDLRPGLPVFLMHPNHEGAGETVAKLKDRFPQFVGEITLPLMEEDSSHQLHHFHQFIEQIQLSKALRLQELQRNVFSFPSYSLSTSQNQSLFSLELKKPTARRAMKRGFFTVESEIQETLDDLCGLEDVRKSLTRNFEQALRGKSRALLLIGPPGCGKTFSVRALAGSMNYPLFSTTSAKLEGPEYTPQQHENRSRNSVEGGGNARLEQLLASARRLAPSIVFIDEIHFSLKNKMSQVSQMLLSCLDGFEKDDRGILVIGATSHEDIKEHPDVDKALFRAGRFREEIRISLPDYRVREDYLTAGIPELLGKKLKKDLHRIVCRTQGMSIADLKQLTEDVLFHIKTTKLPLLDSVEEQSLKYKYGINSTHFSFHPSTNAKIWHEAGHAVVQMKLFPAERIDCVTVCGQRDSGGFVATLKPENTPLTTKKMTIEQMAVGLAGRHAEIMMSPSVDTAEIINTGAAKDISRVNEIAREAIFKYGLDSDYGPLVRSWGNDQWKSMDEKEERLVRHWLEKAAVLARKTLEDNIQLLGNVYKELRERGTLHQEDLDNL
jgi:hypothetical protein